MIPDELLAQASLVRDIFGNHFRQITVDPAWLTPGVVRLAQMIYDERTFDQMPRLAKELEKARCANEEIFSHCRWLGPHVRGCWA